MYVDTSVGGQTYFSPSGPTTKSNDGGRDYFLPLRNIVEQAQRVVSQAVQRSINSPALRDMRNVPPPLSQTINPLHAGAYAALLRDLEARIANPGGWSEREYVSPSAAQISVARRALLFFFVSGIKAPTLMMLPDGMFGVNWRRGRLHASIDFEEDGAFAWAATEGDEVFCGCWQLGASLPDRLAFIISRAS